MINMTNSLAFTSRFRYLLLGVILGVFACGAIGLFSSMVLGTNKFGSQTHRPGEPYVHVAECGAVPEPSVPLEHSEEVALRIIVMVYNRPKSLLSCLDSIAGMEAEGDKMALDVFLDMGKDGKHHQGTVDVAMKFKWQHGPVRVHLQKQHVGIYGQWIDSWRPKKDSKEIALFLEDDLDVSRYAWKWLKAAYKRYGDDPEVQGFSLRDNAIVSGPRAGEWLNLSSSQQKPTFMYKLMGSHGYAPLPGFWRDFQDWFHKAIKDKRFRRPYHGAPNMEPVGWYKGFEWSGKQDTMWGMWCIYYGWMMRKFVVHPNLSKPFKIMGELVVRKSELGLHSGSGDHHVDKMLLREWRDAFVAFPENIDRYDWNGNLTESYNPSK